jgi:hypothetical protein
MSAIVPGIEMRTAREQGEMQQQIGMGEALEIILESVKAGSTTIPRWAMLTPIKT